MREQQDSRTTQSAPARSDPEQDQPTRPQAMRRVQRHAQEKSNTTAPEATQPDRAADKTAWKQCITRIASGGVPEADSLPACPKGDKHPDGNRVACRRLRELQDDPTVPAALREEFLQLLAAELGKSELPPKDGLFAAMQNVFWNNYQKFARQSEHAPTEKEIQKELGVLLRAESYQALMVNRKLTRAYFRRGDWYQKLREENPKLPEDPMGPGISLDWKEWSFVAERAPAITSDDLNAGAMLGGKGSASMWVTGTTQVDLSSPAIAKQLALEGDVAKRALIFQIEPHEAAGADDKNNPGRGEAGAAARRPTALDFMTSDTGGEINTDKATENFGRTETQRDEDGNATGGGRLELLVPPIAIGHRPFQEWSS